MLSRTVRVPVRLVRSVQTARTYASQPKTSNTEVPANQPDSGKSPIPNVSQSNELATSSKGAEDAFLQENVEKAEEMRTMQAPNRTGVWSRSQNPREKAMSGPRFEQTIMADQVYFWLQASSMSAQEHFVLIHVTATTARSDRAHPQTTCSMATRTHRILRRWWRTIGSPKNLHQPGQTKDQLVHILRIAICMCTTFANALGA